MVAWFFVIIPWCIYAIFKCCINAHHFIQAFGLIIWCFSPDMKHHDLTKVVYLNNMSDSTIKTNDTNQINQNNKTIIIDNITNQTNNTVVIPLGDNVLLDDNFNLSDYLLKNHLSSLSNTSYENVSDDDLNKCMADIEKNSECISKDFISN
ncbi:MAG: hypothetical protein LBV42_03580 [Methanobrevibacter sp.]|jgi:hypothetical protein|nr:hypothetical protein [Methanobrevibacter sp.]